MPWTCASRRFAVQKKKKANQHVLTFPRSDFEQIRLEYVVVFEQHVLDGKLAKLRQITWSEGARSMGLALHVERCVCGEGKGSICLFIFRLSSLFFFLFQIIGGCETDTWSTAEASNMTTVSVCVGQNEPVFAAEFTSRYFSGGNVLSFQLNPDRSMFDIPTTCT
jgi:hypothetical protein